MALMSIKFVARICCRSFHHKINSAIPSGHQVLAIPLLSASTTPKVTERARTPYIIFSAEKFGELKHANPGVRTPDIGRMIGQLWRLLPDDQKEVYRARFQQEKAVCDAAKLKKLASMTDAEKAELKDAVRKKRQQRKLRRRRKLNRSLGKPKAGGVNPFVLFVQSKTVERGDAPIAQYMKGLAEIWKIMPEDDKEEFVKQARENSARYRQKLLEWEKKAVAGGHPELVRRVHIKKLSPTPRKRAVKRKAKPKPASKAARRKPAAKAKKPKTRIKDASTQTRATPAGKKSAATRKKAEE